MRMTLNLRIIGLTALVALASCSSKQIDENRDASRKFRGTLRVGMTKAEVSAESGTPVGNCDGSEKGFQKCTVEFWVASQGALSDYSKEKYRVYTLNFEQGLLKYWTENVDSTLKGSERPSKVPYGSGNPENNVKDQPN